MLPREILGLLDKAAPGVPGVEMCSPDGTNSSSEAKGKTMF